MVTGDGVVNSGDPNMEQTLAQYTKLEVSLTLTSKFDVFKSTDNLPDAKGILLR